MHSYPNLTDKFSSNSSSDPTIVAHVFARVYASFMLLILIFGLFGNVLTVIVLRTKHLRQSSTAVYLTTLAIVDIFYLSTSMLSNFINQTFMFPADTRNLSILLCTIQPFLNYTVAFISVWLMVAVTVDRAIWVTLPFRAKIICTKSKAYVVIAIIFFLMIAIDFHFFFSLTLREDSNGDRECLGNYFMRYVFIYIDLLLILILPSIIMLTANLMIGWKLKQMRKFTRQRQSQLPLSDLTSRDCTTGKIGNLLSKSEQKETDNGGRKSSALTAMLVSINVFFMISVLPLMIYDVVFFASDVPAWLQQGPPWRGTLVSGIEKIVYTLWYTNFAVHFILYCLNGPPFRGEVLRLMRSLVYFRNDGRLRQSTAQERNSAYKNLDATVNPQQ